MPAQKLTVASVAKIAAREEPFDVPDAIAPGLYLVVRPTGHKKWAFRDRLRTSRRSINVKIGTYPEVGLKEAREKAEQLRRTVRDGGDPRYARLADGAHEVFEFVEFWLEHDPGRRKREGRPRSAKTNREIRSLFAAELRTWRGLRLREITKDHVLARVDAAKRRSPNRAKKLYDYLRRMFVVAAGLDVVDANPTIGVPHPHAPAPRDRVLEDAELSLVWRAAGDDSLRPFGAMVRLLILTGLRLGEVSRLTRIEAWSLDSKEPRITLARERTKTNVGNEVPLSGAAAKLLREIPADVRVDERELEVESPFFFTTTGKTSFSAFSKAKRKLDALLGPEVRPWQLNDLRRTARTGIARLGVEHNVGESILSHKVGSDLARVYDKYRYLPERRLALEKWAAYVLAL